MKQIDPETLMAYVDGELDPAQRAQVEALLVEDAEARAMVQRFRASTGLLRTGLDQVLDQAVPQRLIDALRAPTPNGAVVELRPRTKTAGPVHWQRLAIAASLLVGVGILTTVLLTEGPDMPDSVVARHDPLHKALETLPSGSVLQAEDGSRITPVLTLRAADGRPCREFEREASGAASFGIACREMDGRWVVQIEISHSVAAADAGGDYAPASGAQDPLSVVLDRLGAGAALPAAEEQRLLGSDWRD